MTDWDKPKNLEVFLDILDFRRTGQIESFLDDPDYKLYRKEVPLSERIPAMPRTPEKMRHYSRKGFDHSVRSWKRSVHDYANFLRNMNDNDN